MRVCLLCYRGNPYCGGQGIYLHHLSKALASSGHEVTILVGPPYPEPTPWARMGRIPNSRYWGKRINEVGDGNPVNILKPLDFFEFATSRLGYFPEPLAFSLRAFRRFRALHQENPFDVVHDVETLGYGLLLARRHGVPVVATVHHPLSLDMAAHLAKAGSWRERYYNVVFFPLIMQGMVARRIHGLITASEAGRREIIRTFSVEPNRVHLVYTGVDLETFSPDPKVPREPMKLLFVGNAQDPRKGIKVLLEAMRLLPPSVRLDIVDQGEPEKNYAPQLVRAMGLGERVKFTGRLSLEELVSLYRRTSVLVLPSRFEGFGLPVVEALGCATPVVVTEAGSLPEVVGRDQGGLTVPPEDPRALAQAIHKVLSNEGLASEMGKLGRKRMEELFSWERTAKDTIKVYRWAKENGMVKEKQTI
jgi:glycosyltransferase involved in cell wall biosynthesis